MDIEALFVVRIASLHLLPLLELYDFHTMRQVCRKWKKMVDREFSINRLFRGSFSLPLRLYQGRSHLFVGWLDWIDFDCKVVILLPFLG